jgi:hypothetical protein
VAITGGWNNNPTALQFSYTYRAILSHVGVVASHSSNVLTDSTNDILADLDDELQGAAKKKKSPRQTSISQQWHYVFQRNFQSLLKRYFAIFSVNFITIFGLDQKL